MEVALAEIAAEGATPDFEDDIDFVGPEGMAQSLL